MLLSSSVQDMLHEFDASTNWIASTRWQLLEPSKSRIHESKKHTHNIQVNENRVVDCVLNLLSVSLLHEEILGQNNHICFV